MIGMADFIGWRVKSSCLLSFPLRGRMACLNHWIPAFAGRLRASSAARSRRRSTTYIPVGVSINDGKGDFGLRRAATGILGGLFQTPLYYLHPCRRASMQACP